MSIRYGVMAFCVIRLAMAAALAVSGQSDALAADATLRMMCATLGGGRGSRRPDPGSGGCGALNERAVVIGNAGFSDESA